MITKEDIIAKYKPMSEYPSYYHESDIEQMMDEYAREQSISFAFRMLKDYTGELFNPAENNLLAGHYDKFVTPSHKPAQ